MRAPRHVSLAYSGLEALVKSPSTGTTVRLGARRKTLGWMSEGAVSL